MAPLPSISPTRGTKPKAAWSRSGIALSAHATCLSSATTGSRYPASVKRTHTSRTTAGHGGMGHKTDDG